MLVACVGSTHSSVTNDYYLVNGYVVNPPESPKYCDVHIADDKIVGICVHPNLGSKTVDVSGKYLIPGLIDGWSYQPDASYAKAYLDYGITSVVSACNTGDRPKDCFENQDAPHVFKIANVFGKDDDGNVYSNDRLLENIDRLKESGAQILDLHYSLNNEQLAYVLAHKDRDLSYVGELGLASYSQAVAEGIDMLIHLERYMLDIAPVEIKEAVAKEPFNTQVMGKYIDFLNNASFTQYSSYFEILAKVPLMPTVSLAYNLADSQVEYQVFWNAYVDFYGLKDVVVPPTSWPIRMVYFANITQHNLSLQFAYKKSKILLGSIAPRIGKLPGIGLWQEMDKVQEFTGKSMAEILAGATTYTAKTLKLKNVGAIAAGFSADILVVKSDPYSYASPDELLKGIEGLYLKGLLINRPRFVNQGLDNIQTQPVRHPI